MALEWREENQLKLADTTLKAAYMLIKRPGPGGEKFTVILRPVEFKPIDLFDSEQEAMQAAEEDAQKREESRR